MKEISHPRVYANKNSDIEIHLYRDDWDNVPLVTVCMTLHSRKNINFYHKIKREQHI